MEKQTDIVVRDQAPLPTTAPVGAVSMNSREIAEIQGLIFSARHNPRDLGQVRGEIEDACSFPELAERSQYSYKKGNTEISGPSIRLAEALKMAYGNMDAGWRELERKRGQGNIPGESTVEAFAWDMQKNVRAKRIFTVRHWRDTKKGGYPLNDEREIYELCANQAARRMRACILELIPPHLQERALTICDETMTKNVGDIKDRVKKMVDAFSKMGVTTDMIEKRLQHRIDGITGPEIVALQKVWTSIRDGYGAIEDFFEGTPQKQTSNQVEKSEAPKQEAPATAPASIRKEANIPEEKKVKNYADPEELEKTRRAAAEKGTTRVQKQDAGTPGPDPEANKKADAAPSDAKPATEPVVRVGSGTRNEDGGSAAVRSGDDGQGFSMEDERDPVPPQRTAEEVFKAEVVPAARALGLNQSTLAEKAKAMFGKGMPKFTAEEMEQLAIKLLNEMKEKK